MGVALEPADDYDPLPSSNPLPPPPPRHSDRDKRDRERQSKDDGHGDGERLENLSNEDFRRMVRETPRRGDEHTKDKTRKSKKFEEEEGDGEKRTQRKFRPKTKEEEKPEEIELPRYRDRAKERREDQNPDYDQTAAELGSLHAVAPPGTVDLRTSDAHRISIENSKFLGGDVEHTHLVKGLDYALLHKVRSEIDRRPEDEEQAEDGKRRARKEDQDMTFRTSSAKLVYQWLVKPQAVNKMNEMFLPGRTAFVFDMDEEFSHDIPTTVHRSKADCPPPQETVTVGVDGTVLERIAKIMAYLRLGSSGKVLKKKKKDKGDVRGKGLSSLAIEDGAIEELDKLPNQGVGNGTGGQQQNYDVMLPPPPPMWKGHNEDGQRVAVPSAAPLVRPRHPKDDIFEDVGVDYMVNTSIQNQSPLSEDMEESPRDGVKHSYFNEPGYGPALPPQVGQEWQQGPGYDMVQGPAISTYQAEWQEYPPTAGEAYAGPWPPESYAYADQYLHSQIIDYGLAAPTLAPTDPRFMTQEEKDRGLGSVFKRDDQRLQQRRELDAREKDPNFISESYSECYPGYQEYNREIVDSDEEEDLTKMDMGGRAKGRLHRWDFESEEDWSKYNEQKEAMPKAAFQFGVKMQDGRKTRKQNKDQKLTNELHKINQILDRKKKERGSGTAYDDGGDYEEDTPHLGKRLRV